MSFFGQNNIVVHLLFVCQFVGNFFSLWFIFRILRHKFCMINWYLNSFIKLGLENWDFTRHIDPVAVWDSLKFFILHNKSTEREVYLFMIHHFMVISHRLCKFDFMMNNFGQKVVFLFVWMILCYFYGFMVYAKFIQEISEFKSLNESRENSDVGKN